MEKNKVMSKAIVERDWILLWDDVIPLDRPLSAMKAWERYNYIVNHDITAYKKQLLAVNKWKQKKKLLIINNDIVGGK